ncbi:MAG: CAP domain-containing protein [Deltaproteobacteria bacterium]|nr:CAP domain-containing protein [Deltaproteobacteria bacterium]
MNAHLRAAPLLAALLACAPPAPQPPVRPPARPAAPLPAASTDRRGQPLRWQVTIGSPEPAPVPAGPDGELYARCGAPDFALMRAAATLVDRQLDGLAPCDAECLGSVVRASGAPQPWPRAWVSVGERDETALAQDLRRPVVAAVALDALADLRPLPVRVRAGDWIALDATLLVPAAAASVVLLGPTGRPASILATLSARRLLSRFRADRAGAWLVQVLATLPAGPQPVLEVPLFAEVEPPDALAEQAGAGGEAGPGPSTAPGPERAAAALLDLLAAARDAEHLPPLRRDAGLGAVALAHARDMSQKGRLGHDLGAGSAMARLEAAGVAAGRVGENVASAATVAAAHRALWASPSHRQNMLDESFRRVGVGVAVDARGRLWVAELFAD